MSVPLVVEMATALADLLRVKPVESASAPVAAQKRRKPSVPEPMKERSGIRYFCRLARSSLNQRPLRFTGWALGLNTSNQSSLPEPGEAIHSLILNWSGSPSVAAMFTPPGLGVTSTQLLLPSGTRPMDQSAACNP